MLRLRSAGLHSSLVHRSPILKAGAILASLAFLAPLPASAIPGQVDATATATDLRPASRERALACASEVAGKTPIQLALRHYIKRTEPKPMRFLMAAGTDSALSESAEKVLQEFGPTYYYAGSEAARQKVRERLEIVGPFPALLVVRRSAPKATSTTEIIRLGGHFVTGEHDGKVAVSRHYTYVCGATGWELKADKVDSAS